MAFQNSCVVPLGMTATVTALLPTVAESAVVFARPHAALHITAALTKAIRWQLDTRDLQDDDVMVSSAAFAAAARRVPTPAHWRWYWEARGRVERRTST